MDINLTGGVKSQPGLEPRASGVPCGLTTELLRPDILTDSHTPVNTVTFAYAVY